MRHKTHQQPRYRSQSAIEDNEQKNETVDNESSTRADEPKICANCGTQIDTKEWHPLITQTDDDGRFRVYAFCDEDCRDEWRNNDSNNTAGGT